MNFDIRKLESLGYRIVKKNFNRLSRAHQRHRQTTDRQTTDGSAIAYSERNVVRSLKTQVQTSVGFKNKVETNGQTDGRTDGRY